MIPFGTRNKRAPWLILLLGGMGILLSGRLAGDEAKKPPKDPPALKQEPDEKDETFADFWIKVGSLARDPRLGAGVAALRDSYAISGMILSERKVWGPWKIAEGNEEEFLAKLKFSPTLDPELVKCLAGMDLKTVPQLTKRPGTRNQKDFLALFSQAAYFAQYVPVEAFAETAKALPNLTFGHLYRDYEKYWGKEVTIDGTLLRIREEEPPYRAQAKGVKTLYNGWIQTDTRGATPVAVIFPHLPKGFQVAETLPKPLPKVEFHGYFLGRVVYRAADGKDHNTILLVGPTLLTKKAATRTADEPSPWTPLVYIVMYSLMGIMAVGVLLIVGIRIMYHRGDRHVRERLAQIHSDRAMKEMEKAEMNGLDIPAPRNDGNGFFGDQNKPNGPPAS